MRTTVCLLALATSVALACAADPEPPADPLSKLEGTWKARAMLRKGATKKYDATYTFSKGKATYVFGKGVVSREMTLAADKTRKGLIEMKQGVGGRTMRYFYKIEKGELYLAAVRVGTVDPKPDFSGDTTPVLILTREKK